MTTDNQNARRSAEDVARLGDEIYERDIRQRVEAAHRGDIVAIDVDSGSYVVADSVLAASERLQTRCPQATVWLVRVGYRALHHLGGGSLRRAQ